MNEPQATKPLDQLTDAELQRLIAEMRGWKVCHDVDRWIVQPPNVNRYMYYWHVFYISEEKAWGDVPNWPQDTHAAAVDCLAEMGQSGYYLQYFLGHWVIGQDTKWICSHDRSARVICEAWIEWKRGQES